MVYRYPAGNPLHPEALKEKQRALRDGFSTPLTLRVHRALSWLRRAEAEEEDQDVRFILLWIGFNAAYAGDVEGRLTGTPTPHIDTVYALVKLLAKTMDEEKGRVQMIAA